MKKTYSVIVLLILISFSVSAQSSWSSSYAIHSRHVNSVFIKDFYHVYMVGGNETNDSIQTIFYSHDAGISWQMITDTVTKPWLKSIFIMNELNGITAGASGNMLKTSDGGLSWSHVSLAGSMHSRQYNSITFTDSLTGYIAGGNPSNDSIATIIKTTDGGNNWSVSMDNLGYCFHSVHFPTANTGYVVGDKGTLYKTSNAGGSWTQKIIPGNVGTRNYSAVYFTSENVGFIVGGNLTKDSIQTILKTSDGGDTWTVIRDNMAPMLNDIYFINSTEGYAVGNDGTALFTNDGGDTWQDLMLPDNSPTLDFNSVRFLDSGYGYIVGKWGIIYRYSPAQFNGPSATTLPASDISATSVKMNGLANANGFITSVDFQYGLTSSYGEMIWADPMQINDTIESPVSATLLMSNLLPDTYYHYRLKAQNPVATVYGADMMFYTGEPEIPNFNFELWDTIAATKPDLWNLAIGNISKITQSCHGNYAVRLANDSLHNNPGAILIGDSENGTSFTGGMPFNERPDSLLGCFNYDIPTGDTALVLVFLKKQGVNISSNIFRIYGTSSGTFDELKFPFQYSSADIPDSMIFGITCTNVIHISNPVNPDNFLIADNLRLTGTSLSVPNADFENWTNFYEVSPVSWFSSNNNNQPGDTLNITVVRTSDAASGMYAAKIRNYVTASDTVSGRINSGNNYNSKFKVSARHQSLTGYFKYFPDNNDSLTIMVMMYKNNVQIGTGYLQHSTTEPGYKTFFIPINYAGPSDIPDSASISIQTYNFRARGNSVVYIDNLNFDGWLAGIEKPIVANPTSDIEFNVFPNPIIDRATITFSLNEKSSVQIRIMDISGRQVALIADSHYTAGDHIIDFSGAGLKKGLYICVINTDKKIFSKKIIIY
jgi:photosystem II stability/assembly factor-like uncharacterized protein